MNIIVIALLKASRVKNKHCTRGTKKPVQYHV